MLMKKMTSVTAISTMRLARWNDFFIGKGELEKTNLWAVVEVNLALLCGKSLFSPINSEVGTFATLTHTNKSPFSDQLIYSLLCRL